MSSEATSEPAVGRSLGTVGIALLVASGLGYVVLIVCGRLLVPESADSSIFLTFWGVVFGIGSALAPIEQEVSRQSALAAVDGGRAGVTALRTIAVGAVTVTLVGALVLVPSVSERLFGGHPVLALVAWVAGIAFAAQFGVRGLLVGQHLVKPYGGLIVAEAGLRLLVVGALVLAAAAGLVPLAIAVAVGSFGWLLFVRPAARTVDRRLDGESWGVVSRRVLLLMASAGLTATVITGYPAMVGLLAPGADPVRLAGLLAALQIARFPLILLAPVQALAVPLVVRLSGSADGRSQLRSLLVKGILGALGLAVVGAVLGWLLGPWALQLVFGSRYQVDALAAAGLVGSSLLLGAILLLSAVLVARAQANRVLLTWAVVAATSALVLLAGPGGPLDRAVLGLVVAPVLGLAVAVACVLRHDPAPAPAVTDGDS